MHGLRFLSGAFAVLLLLGGCDSATDPQPLDARPPEVSAFAFAPDSVFFDDVAANDTAFVDLALSVQAADPDGSVDRVAYTVRWQFAPSAEVSGTLEPDGEGQYAGTVGLVLPRDRRGRYTVTVYAVDEDGLPSNQASGTFVLTGPNLGPPTVDEVEAPETFRPGPSATLEIVAAVSDPDGENDLAHVEGAFPVGGVFALRDDGGSASGDATAGDGRYTVTFGIGAATPGPLPVRLWATDRDGATSDTTRLTIEIVE